MSRIRLPQPCTAKQPISRKKARRTKCWWRRLWLEILEDRILPSQVTWTNPNGGDWDNASNWSSGSIPGAGDNVTISGLLPGSVVAHSQSNIDQVLSISSSAPLTLSAGTLNVGGSFQLSSGASLTFQGGTLQNATILAGTQVMFTDQGGRLDGVTAASNLDLATNSGAYAFVADGLTLDNATVYLGNGPGSTFGYLYFTATETLGVVPGSTGNVVFGKNASNSLTVGYQDTLTIGSGITIQGSDGSLEGGDSLSSIVNEGTIQADDSGGVVPGFVYVLLPEMSAAK
jgi:hypothetical protein